MSTDPTNRNRNRNRNTERATLPAYGMPVRGLANGEVDADGYLRRNPADKPWNLFRIRGPLDAERLAAAVERVTLATDVLHLRLRATDAGPRLVRREPAPLKLEIIEVPATVTDGRLAPEAAAVLAPVLFDKPDLREDPAGRVCLLRSPQDDEQLLAFAFDHSVMDGWALGLLTRAVAGAYRSGDYTPRGRGFEAFVEDLPDEEVRQESLAGWQDLLAPYPLPGPRMHMPGAGPDQPDSFIGDGHFDGPLPARLAADLTEAVARTGLSRAEVLFAATALAAGLWSDGPQPLLSLRHGHTRQEDVLVIGPLVEPCVLLPPSPEPATVGDWIAAHCRANEALPATYGRSIREVAPLAPRNVGVNILPPARPLPFGPGTKAVTASRAFLATLWQDERPAGPSTAAVWIDYYMDRPDSVEVTLTYDTRVLPSPEPLLDTLAEVVTAAAHEPDFPVTVLRAHTGAPTPVPAPTQTPARAPAPAEIPERQAA
ncbi:condensation domain-containing protein [Streptomyces sp. TRM64462]|uniref:condensation domain-containing protein n=1 Tax=Streptomyces sp. TRM64462 TaxID=2741726 RepID=UPI0015868AD1|nr:condensation domain-containing protein [Streptomyces sp. TRM64462]